MTVPTMARRTRDPLELVSLRQLRYFDAAMRSPTFHEAARRCAISQPALSEQIAGLEQALNMRLFDRVGRRAEATEPATQLHRRITACMGDLQAALRGASERSRSVAGHLRIGLVQSYGNCWVEPVVRAALERWPALKVSLARRTAPALEEGVARGDLDIACSFDASARDDLEVRACFAEPLVAVGIAAPASRTTRAPRPTRRLPLAALAGRPLALLPPDYAMRRRIDAVFAAEGLRPDVRFESDALEDLVRAAREQALTAVVNAATVLSLRVRGVATLDAPGLARSACMLRARQRFRSAAALHLWDALEAAAVQLDARMQRLR